MTYYDNFFGVKMHTRISHHLFDILCKNENQLMSFEAVSD